MNMPPKVIVTIGLTDLKIEALKENIHPDGIDTYKIISEPDSASARTRSLAHLTVECVILDINLPNAIKAIQHLHIDYYTDFPILGWMETFDQELYLECVRAGMQDAIVPNSLIAGTAHNKIAASRARLYCQQDESTDRNYLNQLLEKTSDSIYFKDADGRFLRVSQSLAKLFGCQSEKEVLNKTDFDFQAEGHARAAYQDEQSIMRSGQDILGKIEHQILQNGSESWVNTSRLILRNERGEPIGTMGISRDVTELHRSKQALDHEKELLSQIINSLTQGIFVKDENHCYLLCNDAYAKYIGADSSASVIGKCTSDFLTPASAQAANEKDSEALNSNNGESENYSIERELLNGDKKTFICTKKILTIGSDQSKSLLGILHPVS